ncbi:hypothetical protein L0Z31_26195 [Burkholderia vietnamiensis]|uniref:hypothetical protein n=1 Tax=Burkholderia vietnamiensis TaxID=60552 RepID=UPI002019D7D8|nr:hypothetical protein [Burkholderia vietnamiensis]MCO1351384.1 hypothetical protein [Burkholderia vietnamiensis]MCO1433412.1 hypothetical protein [Burkholderia vietnamiensis]UQN48915.1 hypothetical protein L0Y95_16440 [Burkholderia vietnamiensis]
MGAVRHAREKCEQGGSFTSQLHRNERRFDSLSGKFDVVSPETSAVGPLISISLRKLSNFDANSKVMEIITWDGIAGQGMIVAAREGIGRSAGCAIYEKIGDSDFEFVNGQPFCWFFNPSGESNKNSSSIKFTGKIRQSYDGPLNDMWFELFYDRRAGIFCDPSSRSKKFKCGNGFSGQGCNKSSDGK